MQSMIRRLFWCEAGFSLAAVVALVVTLAWPHWIELTLGVDPDHGSSSAEWMIAVTTGVIAVTSGGLARYGWRLRTQRRSAATASKTAPVA
jgi:hypothetical protein